MADEILEGDSPMRCMVGGELMRISAAKQKILLWTGKPVTLIITRLKTEQRAFGIGGFIIRKCVSRTTPQILSPGEQNLFLERRNVWTEFIPNFAHVEYIPCQEVLP